MVQELSEQEDLDLAKQVLAKAIEMNEVPDVTEEIRLRLIALAENNQQANQRIVTRPRNTSDSDTQNPLAATIPLLAKYETDEGTCLYLRYSTAEGNWAAEVFYDPMEEVTQFLSSSREWIKFYHENVQQLSAEDFDKWVFTNACDMAAFMLLKIHRRLQLAAQHMVNETIYLGVAESERIAKQNWRLQGRKVYSGRNVNLSRVLKDESAEVAQLMFEWSRTGKEGEWNPQMRAILLNAYNDALSAAQAARNEFKKIIGKDNTGWVDKVKEKFSKLDEEAVKDLALYKSNSDIALDYAVRFSKRAWNINQSAEHIRGEVLRLARREAKGEN